jgi:malonyl-CoA/methylmalonyl-CoA synthetase
VDGTQPLLAGLDRVALRVGTDVLAGDELMGAVGATAGALGGLHRVAVWATSSLDTCIGVAAALSAGVAACPLDPRAAPNEHAHVIEDFHPQTVLAADDVILPAPVGGLPRLAPFRAGSTPLPVAPQADSTGLVMYTSGTTGLPKGVVLTHAALAACLDGLASAWEWTPDDVLVHGLPLFHVHGLVLGIVGPMRIGGAVHHVGRFSPSAVADAVSRRGTVVFGVPTMWSRLVAEPSAAAAMKSARLLVSGSASLPRPTYDALVSLAGQAPVERYGMTETLIVAAARASDSRVYGSVGDAIAGVSLRLSDVEDGIGELEVTGPTLFNGYLHRPEATASSYTDDGWFRTGDMASRDDSGYRIVGRRTTDLIKTGGHRVGAGEVESALLAHPDVAEAAVIAARDDDLGERVVAYVVTELDAAALVAHAAATLTPYKRPREYRIVGALPRNEMGKVLKSVLRGD